MTWMANVVIVGLLGVGTFAGYVIAYKRGFSAGFDTGTDQHNTRAVT